MTSLRRSLTALLFAGLLLASISAIPPQAAGDPPKPYSGGYYVGKTAEGKEMTLDVATSGKIVGAVQFAYDCPGEGETLAAAQRLKLKSKPSGYVFKDSTETAVLFPSFLSEPGQITVSGQFTSKKRVVGSFRVTSPSCGDTGVIGFSAKVV